MILLIYRKQLKLWWRNIMNRISEIDKFFYYLKKLYYNNPNLEINSKTIYYKLMTYGYTDDEIKNNDIESYFPIWINRFLTSQHLRVFHCNEQKYFLQFHNINIGYDSKCVKLYLSYPKDKIYDCVNKIFDYIDRNNFNTISKVANVIRADDVVLRMNNIDDAISVINFINSDLELSQNARPTNPFLTRDGVVGVAYDDMMSFNSVLSDLIRNYLQMNRNQNTLENVSAMDFQKYVYNAYLSNFRDVNNIKKFSRDNITQKDLRRTGSLTKAIINYDEIYQIIMKSLDEKSSVNDILNNIYSYQNNQQEIVNYYDCLLNSYQHSMNQNNMINDSVEYAKKVFDNYILYASSKYDVSNVLFYINDYILGNSNAITRDKNFRMLFKEHVSKEVIYKITGGNIKEYINYVYSNSIKKENLICKEETPCLNINYAKNILDEYIKYAIKKYGIGKVGTYLESYIDGNIRAITRDYNYRELFTEYIPIELIYEITNFDLDSYISNIGNYFETKTFN